MVKKHTSILKGGALHDPYERKKEELRASQLKRKLERELALQQASLDHFILSFNTKFKLNVVDFCLENRISLFDPDYHEQAILIAAKQHPKLNPEKRAKHRPSKGQSILTPQKKQIQLASVENLQKNSTRTLTDLEAISQLKEAGAEHFQASVKSIVVEVSKARRIRKK